MTDRFVVLDDIADEDLPALFAVADVVVSVPESDGLPLTVLEAMASAAPVVVSDLPGPRDPLLAHPRLIVPGGDAGALTTALDWVLGLAPAERDALGQALRAAVTGEYEYVRNMQAMEQVYRALVPDLV
jgi:glycosyltransferase involved in cell wall biosynthesis